MFYLEIAVEEWCECNGKSQDKLSIARMSKNYLSIALAVAIYAAPFAENARV